MSECNKGAFLCREQAQGQSRQIVNLTEKLPFLSKNQSDRGFNFTYHKVPEMFFWLATFAIYSAPSMLPQNRF